MADDALQVGVEGATIQLEVRVPGTTTPQDLSNQTLITFVFDPPGNLPVFAKVGSLVTDGTDGLIAYTTQAGDISAPGVWDVAAEVTEPGGFYPTTVAHFRVNPSLR
jgi:hypothetical protein